MFDIYVAGIPLSQFGTYADFNPSFEWTEETGGGFAGVTFTLNLPQGITLPGVALGAIAELHYAGLSRGVGEFTGIDLNEGSFAIEGAFKRPGSKNVQAISDDGTFAPVYNVSAAISAAISRNALPGWRVGPSLPTFDLRTATGTAQLDGATAYGLADVLTAQCRKNGPTSRWYLDASGAPIFADDPTSPSLVIVDADPIPLNGQTFVTSLICDYYDIAEPDPINPGAFLKARVAATRSAPSGVPTSESTLDLTGQGPLTSTQAQTAANAALAQMLPEFDRSGSVTVGANQVLTMNGQPYDLGLLSAGVMVQQPGARQIGGAQVVGLDDAYLVGSVSIDAPGGIPRSATLTPLTSSTNVLQIVMSTVANLSNTTSIQLAQTVTRINTAQATADGKGTAYYGSSAPTGGTYTATDVWFDSGNGNRINKWDGAAWSPLPLGTNAIANLAITNSLLAANIDAGKITVGTLSAIAISGVTITGSTIIGNSIRTAASGNRIELSNTSTFDRLNFFTGHASENAPGNLRTWADGNNLRLDMFSPRYGSTGSVPQLRLWSTTGGATAGWVEINSPNIDIGTFSASAQLHITDQSASLAAYNGGSLNSSISVSTTGLVGCMIGSAGTFSVQTGGVSSPNAFFIDGTGQAVFARHSTTTNAANFYIGTAGYIYRSTSRSDQKLAIESVDAERLTPLLDLTLHSWFDRHQSEVLAARLDPNADPDAPFDNSPLTRIVGLLAEEVEATGLTEFVAYDAEGEISGIHESRLALALIPIVKHLLTRIETLETAA